MNARILRFPEVKTRTGYSRSSIDLLEKQNEFPKRVRLGARAVGWHEVDIDAWIAARVRTDAE